MVNLKISMVILFLVVVLAITIHALPMNITAETQEVNITFKSVSLEKKSCLFTYGRTTVEATLNNEVISGVVRIKVNAINRTENATEKAVRCSATITYNPLEIRFVERDNGRSKYYAISKSLKPSIILEPEKTATVDKTSIQPVIGISREQKASPQQSQQTTPPVTTQRIVPGGQTEAVAAGLPQDSPKKTVSFWNWIFSLFALQ